MKSCERTPGVGHAAIGRGFDCTVATITETRFWPSKTIGGNHGSRSEFADGVTEEMRVLGEDGWNVEGVAAPEGRRYSSFLNVLKVYPGRLPVMLLPSRVMTIIQDGAIHEPGLLPVAAIDIHIPFERKLNTDLPRCAIDRRIPASFTCIEAKM